MTLNDFPPPASAKGVCPACAAPVSDPRTDVGSNKRWIYWHCDSCGQVLAGDVLNAKPGDAAAIVWVGHMGRRSISQSQISD